MEEKTYNGWTNYETWAVGLWIDNEQGSHSCWREQAAQHFENAAESETPHESLWSQRLAARSKLAEQIQEEFEEASPLADQASVYSDLLTAALGEVDWHEIADHLLNDTIGEEEEEQIEEPALTVQSLFSPADDCPLVDNYASQETRSFPVPHDLMIERKVAAYLMAILPAASDGDNSRSLTDFLSEPQHQPVSLRNETTVPTHSTRPP